MCDDLGRIKSVLATDRRTVTVTRSKETARIITSTALKCLTDLDDIHNCVYKAKYAAPLICTQFKSELSV